MKSPAVFWRLLLLARRPDVPVAVEPAFDDIDVGIFEGEDVQVYRDWRARHGLDEAPPGGGEVAPPRQLLHVDDLALPVVDGRYTRLSARCLSRYKAQVWV